MSLFKKKSQTTTNTSTSNTLYGSTSSSGYFYIPANISSTTLYSGNSYSISISGSSFIGGAGAWGYGTGDQKTFLDSDIYIKVKLKDGTEVDIKLKDYIKYPYRMGKELEDSTKEEYEEWKMVNEL